MSIRKETSRDLRGYMTDDIDDIGSKATAASKSGARSINLMGTFSFLVAKRKLCPNNFLSMSRTSSPLHLPPTRLSRWKWRGWASSGEDEEVAPTPWSYVHVPA